MLTSTDFSRRRRGGDERGQAMVEFALVLPILLTVMFAAVEFGSAYWTYQQVSAAASEGARRAIVLRSDSSTSRTSKITEAVKDASPNLDSTKLSISVTSSWTIGDPVTVRVEYPEQISILGIELFDKNLVSRRTGRVEQ